MKALYTGIPGLVLLEPSVHGDERGWFYEPFNAAAMAALGLVSDVVQINQSASAKGVLRGLHYQAPPYAQTKLVRCVKGSLYDVAVDVRRGSPTFGRWYGIELSADNKRMLYVPVGFAHGFYALTEGCELLYVVGGAGYAKSAEGGVRYDDPSVGVVWPCDGYPLVNDRDRAFPVLSEDATPFIFERKG